MKPISRLEEHEKIEISMTGRYEIEENWWIMEPYRKSRYTSSYIAFLDILGFKSFVKSYGFDQIKDVFDHIPLDEKNVPIAMTRAIN